MPEATPRYYYALDESDIPAPLCECDDVIDVASDAVRAINKRLSRLDAQLDPTDTERLRDVLTAALRFCVVIPA